jgi:vacuolar-type H+-ATPase subunit C/Vma6
MDLDDVAQLVKKIRSLLIETEVHICFKNPLDRHDIQNIKTIMKGEMTITINRKSLIPPTYVIRRIK